MTSKPVEIRHFESSDAEACFRIRVEAFVKLFYDEIGADGVVNGINAYLPMNYIQLSKAIPIFVAVDNKAQIGFITSRLVDHTTIEILFLYIKLEYHRKGIGTQLINHLEDWIKKEHPEIDRLIVNTAIPKYNQKFYQQNGYSIVGESECQYHDSSLKAIRLIKDLK